MSQPPKNKVPVRSVPTGNRPAGTGGSNRPRSVPPAKRDPFPFVIGGVVGMLVVGLAFVVYLLANNSNKGQPAVQPTSVAGINVPVASSQVPVAQTTANPNTDVSSGPTVEPPPRMDIKEFKALYDDPAKRPLIIDVRAKAAYDQGHIRGAINIPEADVPGRLKEIPKDKLVVAYCQ